MGRRRFLLVGAGVLALLGVAGFLVVWAVLRSGDRITEGNYERIREGMTLAEVEALLGGPPGDYTRGQADPLFITTSGDPANNVWLRGTIHAWQGPQLTVEVVIAPAGGVLAKHCWPTAYSRRPTLSFLIRLRRFLGL